MNTQNNNNKPLCVCSHTYEEHRTDYKLKVCGLASCLCIDYISNPTAQDLINECEGLSIEERTDLNIKSVVGK
jgi:hypothetical protein